MVEEVGRVRMSEEERQRGREIGRDRVESKEEGEKEKRKERLCGEIESNSQYSLWIFWLFCCPISQCLSQCLHWGSVHFMSCMSLHLPSSAESLEATSSVEGYPHSDSVPYQEGLSMNLGLHRLFNLRYSGIHSCCL